MKKFQIGRYLKNSAIFIILFSALGCLVFFRFMQNRQTYLASSVISYTNEKAESGLAPDNTQIDTKEINSSKVVSLALDKMDIPLENVNIGEIASRIQVQPIISEENELIAESLNKGGEEYPMEPTEYLVSFTADSTEGDEFASNLIDTVIEQYTLYYSENHVNQSMAADDISDIYTKNFDYIEMVEEIDDAIITTMESISGRAASHERFRSVATGYTFYDLYYRFQLIQENVIADIFAEILDQKITKDKEVLLSKYQNRVDSYGLSNVKNDSESEEIWNIIESYVKMMRESDNTNITYEYILDDVYDEYNDTLQEEESAENTESVYIDRTVEYDTLIDDYVGDREAFEHAVIDTAYCEYIISVFQGAQQTSSEEMQQSIQDRIESVVHDLKALYIDLNETNKEYNKFLGTENIAMLSSVSVTEGINVRLYLLIAAVAFFMAGCLAAILYGRSRDIFDY